MKDVTSMRRCLSGSSRRELTMWVSDPVLMIALLFLNFSFNLKYFILEICIDIYNCRRVILQFINFNCSLNLAQITALILSVDIVSWYCQLILSADIVSWYCQLILSVDIVSWYCQLILSVDIVSWYCQLIL